MRFDATLWYGPVVNLWCGCGVVSYTKLLLNGVVWFLTALTSDEPTSVSQPVEERNFSLLVRIPTIPKKRKYY